MANSQAFADFYSITHITWGMWVAWLAKKILPKATESTIILITTIVAIIWEIVENSDYVIGLFRKNDASTYFGDSVFNSQADVLFCQIGAVLALKLSDKAIFWLSLIFEIGLLILIRDSVALMWFQIVFDVQAISDWQRKAPIAQLIIKSQAYKAAAKASPFGTYQMKKAEQRARAIVAENKKKL